MKVEHWNETEDGALTELALRRKLEARGYRVNRYVYPPGTSFPTHTHEVDKMDAVFSGRFRITMEDGAVILGPGDSVPVPAGVRHGADVNVRSDDYRTALMVAARRPGAADRRPDQGGGRRARCRPGRQPVHPDAV